MTSDLPNDNLNCIKLSAFAGVHGNQWNVPRFKKEESKNITYTAPM